MKLPRLPRTTLALFAGAERVTAIDFDTRRDADESGRLARLEQAISTFRYTDVPLKKDAVDEAVAFVLDLVGQGAKSSG